MEIGIHIKHIFGLMVILACLLSMNSCGGGGKGPLFDLPEGHEITERMKILVAPGDNREFSYTNKQSAFYYGYTNEYNDLYFQGLTSYRQKLFDEYYLSVDDTLLPRQEAKTTMYFHQLVRDYGPVVETVTLLDDRTVLLVEVKGGEKLALIPVFLDAGKKYDKEWDGEQGILFVTRDEWLALPDKPGMPRWLGISLGQSGTFQSDTPNYIPEGKNTIGSLSVTSEGETAIIFAADHNRQAVADLIQEARKSAQAFVVQKRKRLETLLHQSYVHSDSADLNKALSWAKVSMDGLVMNQDKRGIFAGLPWFNDYWGRDTFISLPGALLVTGQFERAREILRDFGTYQFTDWNDPLYGRIPNRVRPDEVIYNTADGTPWFVREAYEYILYSGDTTFAREIYPVVRRSIEGTIQYRIDTYGFLKHDDADTWMDAKIEGAIPWSARGDRACEIQALWYTQLIAGAKIAALADDISGCIEEWLALAGEIRHHFESYYMDHIGLSIYDHLNPNGKPDHNYRPNQIFCLTVPFSHPFPNRGAFFELNGGLGQVDLGRFSVRLVYPFGVGSLWKKNLHFHPYHHHSYYHYDASYHNGIVWTWNSGPAVTAFCRQGRTFVPHILFDSLTDQILNKGAVGTIAELIDVAPKASRLNPELSGTFTQAWSLAEYLRNFYQDFLGIYPLFNKYGLRFNPSGVLHYFGTIRFIIGTKMGFLQCVYDLQEKTVTISSWDMIGDLPIVIGNQEYLLTSAKKLKIPLPELSLEGEDASKLASPRVPVNTQSLLVKDFLETKLRKEWREK